MSIKSCFVPLFVILLLLMGCGLNENTEPVAQDPEDWPPAQDCGDTFRQDGKASQQVPDCSNVQPQVYLGLVTGAQTDADSKANLRCPNRCPTRRTGWQANQQNCANNMATLTVTGNYDCHRP